MVGEASPAGLDVGVFTQGALQVVATRLRSGEGTPVRWLVDLPAAVVETLRALASQPEGSGFAAAVLVLHERSVRADQAALAEGAVAALRGLTHALTLELGARGRLCLVVARADDGAGVRDALRYLERADFARGATLDLRSA